MVRLQEKDGVRTMSCCKGKPAVAGEISADGMYTLAEIQTRLGLGTHALREARRHGLPVRRIGRRSYVLGKDFLAFAAGRKTDQSDGDGAAVDDQALFKQATMVNNDHSVNFYGPVRGGSVAGLNIADSSASHNSADDNWLVVASRTIFTWIRHFIAWLSS
jgi:hypothetical protein